MQLHWSEGRLHSKIAHGRPETNGRSASLALWPQQGCPPGSKRPHLQANRPQTPRLRLGVCFCKRISPLPGYSQAPHTNN
jgi:hypothetical protein